MAMLKLVKATEEDWEEAYDLYYRSLRKLISEGLSDLFGGMTPEGTKRSLQGDNSLYLLYRKGDQMPVVAISILRKEEYQEYEDVLKNVFEEGKIPVEKVAILNALATRPELQGQGYARQALRILAQELKIQGVEVLVGTWHPDNEPGQCAIFDMNEKGMVYASEPYTWKTPKGRLLERERFAFAI